MPDMRGCNHRSASPQSAFGATYRGTGTSGVSFTSVRPLHACSVWKNLTTPKLTCQVHIYPLETNAACVVIMLVSTWTFFLKMVILLKYALSPCDVHLYRLSVSWFENKMTCIPSYKDFGQSWTQNFEESLLFGVLYLVMSQVVSQVGQV